MIFKHYLSILFFLSFTSYAQIGLVDHLEDIEKNDLKEILANKYLRVLTTKNAFDYYIYQGYHKGYQYEMVKQFVKYLNSKYLKKSKIKIQFDMIPVEYDDLIPMLKEGKGDIIASNLTQTNHRRKQVAFSIPYLKVNEVLIKNKNIKTVKSVFVRQSSSYYESLKKTHYTVKTVLEELTTVNIIELVSHGKYPATIADSYLADISLRVFNNIEVVKPISAIRSISWGVRFNSKNLLKELNQFIPTIKQGSFLGNLYKKRYFQNVSRILQNKKENRISKFDRPIKKFAKIYSWDWRLLVSMCFQESRFNPDLHNKWGAIGLFQIKQMTANEPYVGIAHIKGKQNIENNIHAGIKYLSWINKRYFKYKKKIKQKDKIRLSLAAYNAGPRRVLRAMKLAKRMKLNPHKWFRNVELAMAELHYMEPVTYVSEINKRYVSYKLLGF